MHIRLFLLGILLLPLVKTHGQVSREKFQSLQERVLELEVILKAVNPDSLVINGKPNLVEYILTEISNLKKAINDRSELDQLKYRIRKMELSDSLRVDPNSEVLRKLLELENCKANDC